MTKRIGLINGSNLVEDYDVLQFENEIMTFGVAKPTALFVEEQAVPDSTVLINAGIGFLNVVRVSDNNKAFKLSVENNSPVNLAITGTPGNIGAVIALVPKASVEVGAANPEDGQGVFDFEFVEGLSGVALTDGEIDTATSDLYYWIRLADIDQQVTVNNAEITDARNFLSIENIESISVNTINEKKAGNGVVVEGVTLRDNYIETPEQGGTPSTPPTNSWKIYPKSDGFYIIDDLGNEEKLVAGVASVTVPIEAGENLPNYTSVVRVKDDGKAYLANEFANSKVNGSGIVPGGQNFSKIVSKRIDTDKYVFLGVTAGNTTYAFAGTISNGIWFFGSVSSIGTNTNINHNQIDVITTTKFAITWANAGSAFGKVFSVSGTVLTAGANVTLSNTNTPNFPSVCAVQQGGIGVVFYSWIETATDDVQVRAATISVITQTLGGVTTVDATTSPSGRLMTKRTRENEALLLYSDADSSVLVVVVSQTANTSTLSVNTPVDTLINSFLNNAYLEKVNDDKFVFTYSTGANLLGYIISVSGTVPSISSSTNLNVFNTAQFVNGLGGQGYVFPTETADRFICIKTQFIYPGDTGRFGSFPNGSQVATFGWMDTSGATVKINWESILFNVGNSGSDQNVPLTAVYENGEEGFNIIYPAEQSIGGDPSLETNWINPNHIVGFSNTAVTAGQIANIDLNRATNLTTDSNVDNIAFEAGKTYFSGVNGELVVTPERGGFTVMRVLADGTGLRLLSGVERFSQ